MILNGKRVYAHVLDIPEGSSGPVSIEHITKPAGAPILLSNMRTAMFGQRPMPPVRYDVETRWHQLVEKRVGTWMTDLPIEQRQHDDAFIGYKGRILIGGLGLGYAVTALAHKRHVERLVTVERSAHVAELVWAHTNHEQKGELVVADLFRYLRDTTEKFDRAFFDIWQADGEQTFHKVVVPLRRLAAGKAKRVDCWNEDVMRGQLLMGLTSRLMMLQHTGEASKHAPTLEQLCERVVGICAFFTNWSLPYWRWYRRARPAFEAAQEMAAFYARIYGLPRADEIIADRFGEWPTSTTVEEEAAS